MTILGKQLTPKQQEVRDLQLAGKTRLQICRELGVSMSTITKRIVMIRKKLALSEPKRESPAILANEAAQAIDQVNTKMLSVGIPDKLRNAHIRRLKVKHTGEETPSRAISDEELKQSHREKLFLVHSYIDDKVVAEASLRDLAVASAQLTEKLQLLEGKPTQIISDLERKRLHDLVPLLVAEAKRRGITIDGQVTEKVVTPA